MTTTMIEISKLTKRYGYHDAVDRVTLDVHEGECCVILGPSGCGKSTTLRAINRLIEPDEGTITVRGRDVRDYRPEELRRSMGYVVQSVGLFPHMTVAGNVAIVPRLLGWTRQKIDERVDELLELVGLDPSRYRDRYPSQLSGGEAQRVGVARALAADPPILLMDEPFGALDPITRKKLQNEFAALKKKVMKTIVFVTHDIYEAVILGDRIALLNEGRLEQHGTPEEIWKNPASEFVQQFVGSEFGLHVLSRHHVTELVLEGNGEGDIPLAPTVHATWTLKDAVSEMIRTRSRVLVVRNHDGSVAGTVTFDAVVDFIRNGARDA